MCPLTTTYSFTVDRANQLIFLVCGPYLIPAICPTSTSHFAFPRKFVQGRCTSPPSQRTLENDIVGVSGNFESNFWQDALPGRWTDDYAVSSAWTEITCACRLTIRSPYLLCLACFELTPKPWKEIVCSAGSMPDVYLSTGTITIRI